MKFLESVLRNHIPAIIDERIAKAPKSQQKSLRKQRAELIRYARENIGSVDFDGAFTKLMEMVRQQNRIQTGVEEGQIRGLAKTLPERHVPGDFNPAQWIMREVGVPLIVGDGCIVAVADDGRVRSILGVGESWRAMHLPISPSQVLIGWRREPGAELSGDELNRASAELSSTTIFASRAEDDEIQLATLIGTGAAMRSNEEMLAEVEDVWSRSD